MRRDFPKSVKRDAFMRANGKCEECSEKILGVPEYDHVLEDFLGGEPVLDNCKVLCGRCHKAKTKARRPALDKTRRLEEKRMGLRKSSRGFRGWRKFDGTPVY